MAQAEHGLALRAKRGHHVSTVREKVRAAIVGTSITIYCHDQMRRGEGAPSEEDMKRFSEESEALADLWESTLDE